MKTKLILGVMALLLTPTFVSCNTDEPDEDILNSKPIGRDPDDPIDKQPTAQVTILPLGALSELPHSRA